MHIVLGILAFLGGIGVLIYRLNQASDGVKQAGEAVHEVASFVRRSRWKNRARVDVIKEIDEPPLAATVMMIAIAQAAGSISQAHISQISANIKKYFQLPKSEEQQLFGEARWLVGDATDPNTTIGRVRGAIDSGCNESEKRELIQMLVSVARAEGQATDIQQEAITNLARLWEI